MTSPDWTGTHHPPASGSIARLTTASGDPNHQARPDRPTRLSDIVRGAGSEQQAPDAGRASWRRLASAEAVEALTCEMEGMYRGNGDPTALVDAFRRAAVLVPVTGGGLWSAAMGGVRWIYGFSSEVALARFALTQETSELSDWEYMTVFGARLLDVVIPAVQEPAGVALDVGSDRPMIFPPVMGIVPNAVALDARAGEGMFR
ncbi:MULTISPECIES: SseB family protein [unclassified Streptomyces]|uniref:SseB family protein n=1 Tax=unclassified Streptomyces TaxID=2593676 RepID=UPI001FD31E55|nr:MULTISPECIES: SseB family protein [unclassified Streptomyces]MCZ4100243.1 SseB family protein [Streptomyces sp. H39-C1]